MHRECSVTELPFLHFELTEALIVRLFFVLFLQLPRVYFCAHKEMCDTPIGTTAWIIGLDRIVSKKLKYGGREVGIVTFVFINLILLVYAPISTGGFSHNSFSFCKSCHLTGSFQNILAYFNSTRVCFYCYSWISWKSGVHFLSWAVDRLKNYNLRNY